jgi:hypothetical protein
MTPIKFDDPVRDNDPDSRMQFADTLEPGQIDFLMISGKGILRCNSCGLEQSLTAAFPRRNPELGHQCQQCGKLQSFRSTPFAGSVEDDCECGGRFRRDRAIFCPQCRSFEVWFKTHIIE